MQHLDITDNGLFVWTGNYFTKDIPKSAKMRWNPSERRWETASLDIAKYLINYSTPAARLKIDSMSSEAKKCFEMSSKQVVDSDIVVDVVAPNGKEYYPFQIVGINLLCRRNYNLLADDMGLGKTVQAIGYINIICPKKILIVSPSVVTYNWLVKLKEWLLDKNYRIQVLTSKTYADKNVEIYITSYDMLITDKLSWLKNISFDLIIGDEAHRLKRSSTKTSKAFKKIAKKADKITLITGTPSLNKPIELYNLLTILKYPINWMEYATRYCDMQQTDFGYDFSGSSNIDELQYKLRESIMIRRMKNDVLHELPSKTREIIYCDPTKFANLLRFESTLFRKKLDTGSEYDDIMNAISSADYESITELTKLRKDAAISKIQSVIKHIDGMLEHVDKIVVFAHHRDVIEKLYDHYDTSSVRLYGGMTEEEKYESEKRFQEDPTIKIFIGSLRAAGVGITLTSANVMLFVEMDYTPGIMLQAEDRLHRIGQKNNVIIQYMVVDGSIDAIIAEKLGSKQKVLDAMFNIDKISNYTPSQVNPAKQLSLSFELPDNERLIPHPEKMASLKKLKDAITNLPDAYSFDYEVETFLYKIMNSNGMITNQDHYKICSLTKLINESV